MSYGGWYARRRGILEHLDEGTISLLDSAVHDFLCLIADHETGVCRASAEKIHALCPSDISLRAIQRSLARLEEIGWVKRFRTPGKRGNYPIVLGKYFVTDASLRWKSVNLEKTTDWRNVQFDPVTDPSFVGDGACQSSVTEPDTDVSPVQEVRSKKGEARRTATPNYAQSGTLKERLKDKIKREDGETAKEFYHALKTKNPDRYKELVEAASATGFRFPLDDETVGVSFLIAICEVFAAQKPHLDSGELSRGLFCTKVIDACVKARIPYPPAFQAHRDALRKQEKSAA